MTHSHLTISEPKDLGRGVVVGAHRRSAAFAAWAIALAWCGAPPARSQSYTIQQVDLSTNGVQGYGLSGDIHVSGDGRYVAFTSFAGVLVPGDTNGVNDVFVRDLWAGTTERASLDVAGQQIAGASEATGISYDGRFVLFVSAAAVVPALDPDPKADVFLRDRLLGTTELISVTFDGSPSMYDCKRADISADGRFVAFDGFDDNLVPGDANGTGDVYVRDRLLGMTEIVSVASDGAQGDSPSAYPAISADGTRIIFLSKADNFHSHEDGDWDYFHLFLRDRSTGLTQPIDLNPHGRLGNQTAFDAFEISPDGSTVVFVSQATDLVPGNWNGFVGPKSLIWRDGSPLEYILVFGRPAGSIEDPSFSTDGRFLAFAGGGWWWVPGDPTPSEDVFLRDTWLDVTQQVSSNGYADPQNVQSERCSMSWDGRVVAFQSYAGNLVPGSTLNVKHAFARISASLSSGMVYCWPLKSPGGCQPQFALSGASSASTGLGH
jgi:Tol biopolymer transport system component